MKNTSSWFYVLMISMLFVAVTVVYIVSIYDRGLALGLGFAFFVVVSLFLQQFISGEAIKNFMANFVSYEHSQADVKGKELTIQIEAMKMARSAAQTNNTLAIMDAKQIQTHANKIAGLLTEAEVQKIRAQMMGVGGDEEDASDFTL